MRYLFIILNSIVFIGCYAQNNESCIKADLCFIAAKYNNNPGYMYNGYGIIIQLYNDSNEDYYIEDGTDIGYNLIISQNNVIQKEAFYGTDEKREPSRLNSLMSNGNGVNNFFNKPEGLIEYTRNLIIENNKKANIDIKPNPLTKSLKIIYLKAKSSYSVFFNLEDYKLKGKYQVSLGVLDFSKPLFPNEPYVDLPDKIKEYKKYKGILTSAILEISIP